MATLTFRQAHPVTHRDELFKLNLEYMSWVSDQITQLTGLHPEDTVGMDLPNYVASMMDKACGDPPPRGAFYLLEADGQLAGMGGLRRVRDGVAEVKRFYVRPAHRGQGLGDALLRRVLDDARAFGYRSAVLDTAPFMKPAHRLYEQFGFVDRGPYEEAEVPKELHPIWRFMECAL